MSYYTKPYIYCPLCAKPLEKSLIDNQLRSSCPSCSYIDWGNFSLGVGGVLWNNEKVLLVQRNHNPGKGVWTIPGGYVNQEEPIKEAIEREILEKTGIKAKPLSIIALRDRPSENSSEKHDLYIIFLMSFQGGSLKGQEEEVSNLGFFTLEQCAALQIPQLTLKAIEVSRTDTKGLTSASDLKLLGSLASFYHLS
ncbi:NUDIX domain-containing protein [Desulfosporosinus hippei]|uniref:ADP-ribose pyrophosphatase YjhB, NUDIX family n=1 Tax=Desulfosporosinus hippei DSM 8344 TaxID=1121419 RepID=A0A1G8DF14_9FIRM|nr:NUDIX hydrolase [Desulfosporosinus hippei]SDH56221.1 ADP-ribose pyrophosphatase YjhB, NUDIX family [Desulfosporosinus hippei DSM 8344]